jgi:hypothetical protein
MATLQYGGLIMQVRGRDNVAIVGCAQAKKAGHDCRARNESLGLPRAAKRHKTFVLFLNEYPHEITGAVASQ